ncbi:MAG: Unknown protein [uncultured Sulfurovum sp.]|uniref:Wadjet protein JetD C-terminal domain-containing protein n=1 Tax=uncultured Sulfurovum sp. TaxID=269237 RepID=A0A6S6SEC1_9BACT|nr:MAG: Unknown protein [uncultured Sulfurovum sp.]
MDKKLLKQAQKFRNDIPTSSQTKYFNDQAKQYQSENHLYFVNIKHGKKSQVLDWDRFFVFLSEVGNDGKTISSFEDIEQLLSPTQSRKENIKNTGDSKSRYISVFDNVVIFQHGSGESKLYKNSDEIIVGDTPILAVENGETFLNIYDIASKFGYDQFLYLGGMSNSATREFLKDKKVTFFLDYDIEAIRIYDSFKCRSKSFFKHPKLENYFSNAKYRNEELYRKQLSSLPSSHDELQWLIDLINQYSAVIEQEVF